MPGPSSDYNVHFNLPAALKVASAERSASFPNGVQRLTEVPAVLRSESCPLLADYRRAAQACCSKTLRQRSLLSRTYNLRALIR
jgi:hypothetical protein